MLNPNDEQNLDLLVRISEMYYIQGKTQKEISESLGLSRSGVSRLLQAARDQGIVQITVHNPARRLSELAQALTERFGLQECRLCPGEENYDALQSRLAYQAAESILALLKSGDIIGLGLSSTVHRMVELLPGSSDYACLRFVPISGGTNMRRGAHINYTVEMAANKFRGDYVPLNLPFLSTNRPLWPNCWKKSPSRNVHRFGTDYPALWLASELPGSMSLTACGFLLPQLPIQPLCAVGSSTMMVRSWPAEAQHPSVSSSCMILLRFWLWPGAAIRLQPSYLSLGQASLRTWQPMKW